MPITRSNSHKGGRKWRRKAGTGIGRALKIADKGNRRAERNRSQHND